jgi:predicted metal-dependent peptidase
VAGKRRPARRPDPATENRERGIRAVRQHPIFAPLCARVHWTLDGDHTLCPAAGWAVVSSRGVVALHPARRGEPDEWAWVAAHSLMHLGFEHLAGRHRAGWTEAAGAPGDGGFDEAWNVAACLAVNRFLAHLKIGRPPAGLGAPTAFDHLVTAMGSEDACAQRFRAHGVPPGVNGSGTGGPEGDLRWAGNPTPAATSAVPAWSWARLLASGLAAAAAAAVDVAGGAAESLAGGRGRKTPWRLALDWFAASYPLLGGLGAAFTLVEDADLAREQGIGVAAVSPAAAELYVNPLSRFSAEERRFVIAHELLHAGLRHDTRGAGRDPWLWNVACDYVINDWLTEMGVGARPDEVLYDKALHGMSAEEVYDRIAADRRRYRKLATLRGVGLGDVLPRPLSGMADPLGGVGLDEFYRRSLADGLGYHAARGRGLLPAGLVEEIRALAQPPVPWDVRLARWFDDHFVPLERRRTYARASRRQSATPGIARPGRHVPPEFLESRTFGVVLDTSGSMDTRLLGKALGAVASYAVSREVPAVRVVFCDAQAHDGGWMEAPDIAGRVRVRGRGGTVLQPGVDLLESARDFPADGPLLVITDGWCDRVRVRREHAYLIPAGAVLPFVPRGPVFRFA